MIIKVNIDKGLLEKIKTAADHQDLTLDETFAEMAEWYLKDFGEVVESAERHESWANKWVKELQREASPIQMHDFSQQQ